LVGALVLLPFPTTTGVVGIDYRKKNAVNMFIWNFVQYLLLGKKKKGRIEGE
jgi:hypothetical protein